MALEYVERLEIQVLNRLADILVDYFYIFAFDGGKVLLGNPRFHILLLDAYDKIIFDSIHVPFQVHTLFLIFVRDGHFHFQYILGPDI